MVIVRALSSWAWRLRNNELQTSSWTFNRRWSFIIRRGQGEKKECWMSLTFNPSRGAALKAKMTMTDITLLAQEHIWKPLS